MDNQEILRFCLEKGFLLDKEVLSLFNETQDIEVAKLILDKIKSREFNRPTGFHPKWCDCYTYEKYLNINQ